MWLILALLAGLFLAVDRMIIRSIVSSNSSPFAFLAVHNTLAGLFLLPFLFIDFKAPESTKIWLLVGLAVLLIYGADLLLTKALETTEATVFQFVTQLRHIMVLIGAAIVFGESISFGKVFAIALLLVGVGIAVLNKQKIKLTPGLILVLWSTLLISIISLVVKDIGSGLSLVLFAMIALIGSGLLAFAKTRFNTKQLKATFNLAPRKIIFAAIIFAAFEISFFAALDRGEASRVTPVTQSSLLFTIVGSYLFLGERSNLKNKIVGCILVAAGIIGIYIL